MLFKKTIPIFSMLIRYACCHAHPDARSHLTSRRLSLPDRGKRKHAALRVQILYIFLERSVMGKSCKVVVCGQAAVGKTAVLEQLLYANHVAGSETMETLEDIYIGSIETDRGTREQVRFYDTRGLRDGTEFPRHYYSFADGFVLVYSIDSKESFKRMEALKKDIDRHRDKKEVTIVVLGNKLDKQEERRVDANMAQNWAKNEKVRLWELSVADRRTLVEPFVYLASKMTQPQSKSTFPLSRNKNKGSGPTDG
ncbi:NF-kappa-B inhibitor-interacting Ras-like protein 2 isoform X1 [Syngnathus scovelli]|uniref:NF-kappa-B inhibitor-interacting Ras-like protein 2 isoform X1 n=2 Tax=Syngnathus TaxID=103719 RepID=UPI00210FC608|nr:NF-kappa-B inhibitor-interacting Ras-like protein 2 isoform X1 [Syngnathus scovelli]